MNRRASRGKATPKRKIPSTLLCEAKDGAFILREHIVKFTSCKVYRVMPVLQDLSGEGRERIFRRRPPA